MRTVVQRQVFVPLPLLRAIEQLPTSVGANGVTLRFTGEVTSARIVRGFNAHRALVDWDRGTGHVDLSSAGTCRSDMSLHLVGISAARAEQLLLALRAAMTSTTENASATASDDRIDVCQTA